MTPLIQECATAHTPESLVEQLQGDRGIILLRSGLLDGQRGRYSFVVARPFLTVETRGAQCELRSGRGVDRQFGNPWSLLEKLLARYELVDDLDLPFPLGGCFGYWGYELKNFVEPRLPQRAVPELDLPDCHVGFYGSLVAFDHRLAKTWIIAVGLTLDGSRDQTQAAHESDFWRARLGTVPASASAHRATPANSLSGAQGQPESNFSPTQFMAAVKQAQAYIGAGDIYQVNLAQRFASPNLKLNSWQLYQKLAEVSPAPFSAFMDGGNFQIASASPELFLRMSGARIITRPIKGTRPRGRDATEDTQLSHELQTSPKELAELIMITDLLRNDLGKVCEFGSVQVPELIRLERYAQVQHLVSTVEGRLRPEMTHLGALASCFPGGSITGAPKIRAMEIIDELEPVTRGPYTGALGYVGFNRESQLSILIRTAICQGGTAYFHTGAGIVADSVPASEYEETLAKASGFFQALHPGSSWKPPGARLRPESVTIPDPVLE